MRKGKFIIGIIGCGGIANQKHLPSLKALVDKCELTAFCDIIEERAVKAAQEYGSKDAKVYTNYKELLKDKSLDIVNVLTPNVAHSQITIDAFAAGKNVFCEKPMSHSGEASQKMIDAWQRSGKHFTVGYQNRFRPEVQMLYKTCRAGELGEIYHARAHAVRRRAVPTWGVFPNKALQGGGPLIDIGTHALDITLWIMDNYKPARVTGSVYQKLGCLPEAAEANLFGPWDPKTYEVEDSAFGMIEMENGASIFLEASWALNARFSKEAATTLYGTKAGAEIESGMTYPDDQLIINRSHNGLLMEESRSKSGNIAYFEGASNALGVAEAEQWLDAIKKNTKPLVHPEQAQVVTQILEAIYKSSEQKKEILF